MQTLYPELFRILWDSTLPCFKEENKEEHMMLSCEVAGVEVNCSKLFIRVPTDTGMCCALNVDDSLRASEYQELVKEMQGEDVRTHKVETQEGIRNGLRLTLDLHSNTVSFGSLDQQFSAFNLFIGQPAQFPMMRDKSIRLEPGREHFVDLSATVVATDGIKDILPEARGCLFTDEGSLEFYKSYTFSNCRLECAIRKAEEKHKCIPWYLPKVRMPKISQENECPPNRGKTRPHATRGLRTSSRTRCRTQDATTASRTATMSPICQKSPQQSSGELQEY